MSILRGAGMEQSAESNLDAEAIKLELDRIVSSDIFFSARRSRMFLRYVVERSLLNSAPKEYEIAVEVLGRGANYDPDIDATVRVEAGRLRHRLREYYDTAGRADPILIEIPKGGYAAVFRTRDVASEPLATPRAEVPAAASANGDSAHPVEIAPNIVELPSDPGKAGSKRTLDPARLWRIRWWSIAVLACVVLGILATSVSRRNGRGPHTAGPIRSLAVLPLQNLSGNPDEDYFADGMTDALITELAHTPQLRVVSRTSVMQEKGNQKSLRQIASELNVDAVVEGSVVRSGDRVRITAQLIDARDDRHLWAQSYEEQLSNILELQDKVVHQIAIQTQVALAPAQQIVRSEQVVPAAYDAYLRGLYFLNQRQLNKSVEYLQQAVALDNSYPAAYAGLAEALTSKGVSGGSTQPEEQSEALAAAKQAIALDPTSGEAYAALGLVEINYGKDWAAAGRDLEKGVALSPSNPLARMQYSIYLDAMGRPEDAVTQMRRALQLDPRSFLMNRHLGVALYFARHYDEALLYLERAVEMEPTRHDFAQSWISRTYEVTHRYDDAVRSDLMELGSTIPSAGLAPLRLAYQRGGWKAYQVARIHLISSQPRSGCDLYEVGESYLRLGKRDRAFAWLARGVEAGCYWEDSLPVDPLLDTIRGDPRFLALLREAHLAAPSTTVTE